MSTKVIPQQTIITCDLCGMECGNKLHDIAMRRRNGRIIIEQTLLDLCGDPAAGGKDVYDLCDGCLSELEGFIKGYKA